MRLRDPDRNVHMACIWVLWAQFLEPLALRPFLMEHEAAQGSFPEPRFKTNQIKKEIRESMFAGVPVVVGVFAHIAVVLLGGTTCRRTCHHQCRKGHQNIPFHTRRSKGPKVIKIPECLAYRSANPLLFAASMAVPISGIGGWWRWEDDWPLPW